MTTFLYIVFGLGILIFFHELGHFLLAKKEGVKVEKFSLGFGPKIFAITLRETEYIISLVPLGGYVKMAGVVDESMDLENIKGEPWEFLSKTVWQRIKIIMAGPVMNFLLAFFIFSVLFMGGVPKITTKIGMIKDGFPAQTAGLRVGDKISEVDGKQVFSWSELVGVIQPAAGRKLKLTVERGKEILKILVIPKEEEGTDVFGRKRLIGFIGIGPGTEIIQQKNNFFQGVYLGAEHTFRVTVLTYKGLWMLITGQVSPKNIHGPIFIAKLAGEQAQAGPSSFFLLIAFISINLAVLNLLPVPILDGGHCMFLIIEGMLKKPLSIKAQDMAQKVGLSLLIALMLFATYNDILVFFAK